MASVATLQRISATQLAELIRTGTQKLAIVDVRDDDHIGGHIKGSLHYPSSTFDVMLPTLVRKVQDADTVVFHCALSQQRGPGAALRYLREMERSKGDVDGTAAAAAAPAQKVYVLDQGFVGWQAIHGEDVQLTENYHKALWQDNPFL